MADLIAQRCSVKKPEVTSDALQHGIDSEPLAIGAYEWETGETVEPSGFIVHPRLDYVGCSPDGLVGSAGGIEAKCPHNTGIHIKTIISGEMPSHHIPQVQGCMWVTGREWWDFISFSPVMPAPWDYFIKRIYRDDKYILSLKLDCIQFENDLQDAMKAVSDRASQMVIA
jgi:hypothetical protein